MPPVVRKKLLRARVFIQKEYLGPISLHQISAQANLSPFHFQRLYKRAFGETPHQYLSRLRLERAKTLLRTSQLSVSGVCFEVGFESLSSFSGWFLREVGLSPSRYRKLAKAPPPAYQSVFIPSCFLKPEPSKAQD